MIRQVTGSLLCLGLAAYLAIAADEPTEGQAEPPVRLKKKVRPAENLHPEPRPEIPAKKTEPTRQPDAPKEEAPPDEDLEAKLKEVINRVSKNLAVAEKSLDKNDPGDSTQQVQRDIVRDLDELIEQTKRRQQEQQERTSASSSLEHERNQQTRGTRQTTSEPQAGNTGPMPNSAGNPARGGKSERGEMSRIADLYKDIWGHLPETLRQEMDQYAREQFMAKYQELLKQYYATIAEKGRRKSERE